MSVEGNKNALKLKTPELREEAYKSYCDHLASGKGKKSWWFEHPDITLTWETMEKYIRENTADFDPIKKKVAESKGYRYWEGVVHDSATGINKDANTASIQMWMRNRYGWDRSDQPREDEESKAESECDKLLVQISEVQTTIKRLSKPPE